MRYIKIGCLLFESNNLDDMLTRTLILILYLYIFFADIIIAFSGVTIIKPLLALFAIILIGINSVVAFNRFEYKTFIFVASILLLNSTLSWGKFENVNQYLTVFFAVLLFLDKKFSEKILFYIFIVQLFAVLYEFLTHNILYQEVNSGVFNQNEFDYTDSVGRFDTSGFRAKGIFPGTLVASCFVINMALLYSKNLRMLLLILIMAVMVNGRMAMIITFITFFLRFTDNYRISLNHRKVPRKLSYLIVYCPLFFIIGVIAIQLFSPEKVSHFYELFDFSNPNHWGRIERYLAGINEYFNNYSLKAQLIGYPGYELFDLYNRPIPPESELIGMLLELGLIGFSFYIITIIYVWKKSSLCDNLMSRFRSYKFVLFWTLICMIQYRHILGNQRGILFWFLIFSILDEIKLCKNK